VVNGAPQVNHLAVELHVHLVQVPTPVPKASHSADPLAANVSGEQRPEPVPPVPNGFVANVDAALEQKVFDVAQAERKPNVHHHDQPYRLG
jgi:hypothetical protein